MKNNSSTKNGIKSFLLMSLAVAALMTTLTFLLINY